MRFATISAAAMTFAVSALAQVDGFDPITSPSNHQEIAAGEKLSIKWQPGDVKGAVRIGLIGGATQNTQVPLTTISSGVDNQAGAFEWTIPADLGDKAVYGLTITLESNPETFQYSFPFHITAKEAAASSAPAATTEAAGGYKTNGYPVVTVSLSSAAAPSSSAPAYSVKPVSSAPAAPSSEAAAPTTSTAAPVYSTAAPPKAGNATYSAGVPTTIATVPTTNSTKPTGTPSPIPTAGASRVATGSVLAVGAMAAFFFL